jgi:beta-lactamase class A
MSKYKIEKSSMKFKYIFFAMWSIAVFFVGLYGRSYLLENRSFAASKEDRQSGYKFINPLLECNDNLSFPELRSFDSTLRSQIQQIKKDGEADSVSLYFRDLNNGPWIGIGENEDFWPASLLKLPLMIAYLKKSETEPDLLNKKISYSGKSISKVHEYQKDTPKEDQLKLGESYSVRDLLRKMIIYSDNNAWDALVLNINIDYLKNVFVDLGVEPKYLEDDSSISVKDYASFFRILFNSSYLNRTDSEMALSYLSRTIFDSGLRADIPKNIAISHKFGIHDEDGTDQSQLHDCGIIYYPQKPYLLCIMTEGKNIDNLAGVIQDLSMTVYQNIAKQSTH